MARSLGRRTCHRGVGCLGSSRTKTQTISHLLAPPQPTLPRSPTAQLALHSYRQQLLARCIARPSSPTTSITILSPFPSVNACFEPNLASHTRTSKWRLAAETRPSDRRNGWKRSASKRRSLSNRKSKTSASRCETSWSG
jgi:hypothetical protein